MPTTPLVIGVDAGGSKTRASLARCERDGRFTVVGNGTAGPANPLGASIDGAFNSISSAIDHAWSDSGEERDRPAQVAVIAVAGSADPGVRALLSDKAHAAGIASVCRIETDATPLLATAARSGPCVGLISGTGSIVLARSASGEVVRRGGWGYLLGDEGSGYSIGRAAIRATLGGTASDQLAAAVCHSVGAATPSELIRACYASDLPQRTIASSAKEVLELAEHGDPIAAVIAEEAATGLAQMLLEVESAAGISDKEHPVVLTGGTLVGSTLLRERLLTLIDRTTENVIVAKDATIGCLRLAAAAH